MDNNAPLINENETPFKSVSFVKITTELSAAFQAFMEGIHFKTMYSSGCFSGAPLKIITADTEGKVEYILYIHGLRNTAEWNRYNNTPGFRDKAREEFIKHNAKDLASGDLVVLQAQGYPKQINMYA